MALARWNILVSSVVPVAYCLILPVSVASTADTLCFEQMPESKADCLQYIEQLKSKSDISSTDLVEIGQSLTGLSAFSVDEREKQALMEEAIQAYERAQEIDPKNIEARHYQALLYPREEMIRILLEILEEYPEYSQVIPVLDLSLRISGGSENLELLIQAIERSYRSLSGERKWYAASRTYNAYQVRGDADGAASFRSRVAEDMGIAEPVTDPAAALTNIGTVCSASALYMDFTSNCLEYIQVLSKTLENGSAVSRSTANTLVHSVLTLAPYIDPLNQERPGIRAELQEILENIESSDVDPVEFQLAKSLFLAGENKIAALRMASQLEGSAKGKATYWLGQLLAEQGYFEEAIDTYDILENAGISPYSDLAKRDKIQLLERLEAQ